MLELTKDNFQTEVVESERPVLVDFWAPWCGPCRIQGPIIEELARLYEAKPITIAKVNVDENREIAAQYHISSIPTLIIFQKGEIKEEMIGVQSKGALIKRMDGYFAS